MGPGPRGRLRRHHNPRGCHLFCLAPARVAAGALASARTSGVCGFKSPRSLHVCAEPRPAAANMPVWPGGGGGVPRSPS